MSKYIFITGGVMSSLGKGIAAASIGTLMQARGYSVRIKKLDPYINIDPGTMSPHKHGEVFVMGDGCEADLDFGHYERFTDIKCTKKDSITTGKIYESVLEMERKGEYLGSDIQIVPHITDKIKNFILDGNDDVDFVICEIGGTVGDMEGLSYIEALRQIRSTLGNSQTISVHLTYLIYLKTSGELKTKPTQHSVRQLLSMGISPDILLCRTEKQIDDETQSKLAMFCGVRKENVIQAIDLPNIYLAPMSYHAAGLDQQICKHFQIFDADKEQCANDNIERKWGAIEKAIVSQEKTIKIAVVGKYIKLKDTYLSLAQAIIHAGFSSNVRVDVDWISSGDDFADIEQKLRNVSGVIIPGGFGARDYENKLRSIQFARENKVPFLGICLGMQLAVIESCQNIAQSNASSREFTSEGDIVIDFMDSWEKNGEIQKRAEDMGGTMRLGNYACKILQKTRAYDIYQSEEIVERHRHRYEVNIEQYKDLFEKAGLIFSGFSADGKLVEIVERKNHPFFIATQAHPEFRSRPFAPHPLFSSFVTAAIEFSGK